MSVGRDIGRAGALLLAGTAGVQAIAFARSLVIARWFGTGPALDAYYAALTLPSLIAAVITIAAEAALLPLYLERLARGGPREAELVYGRSCAWILLGLAAAAAMLAAGAEIWTAILAPGFDSAQRLLTARLLRLGAGQIVLSGAADLAATLYLAHRRFLPPVTAPVVGAGASLAVLIAAGGAGAAALPLSLVAGSLVQTLCLALPARRHGLRLRLRSFAGLSGASEGGELRTSGPSAPLSLLRLLGGAALTNLQPAIDRMFASTCPPGSIAALGYGYNLSVVPSQLFIKTVDSAAFPFLSQQAAEGRDEEVRATFRRALRLTLVLVAPSTAAILALGPEAVRLVFERGSFGPESTRAVAAAWGLYALGLIFKTAYSLATRLLSALRDTHALLVSAAAGIAATTAFNALLVPRMSFLGVALAGSLTSVTLAFVLLARARRRLGPLGLGSLVRPISVNAAASVSAGVGMAAVASALACGPLVKVAAAGGAGAAIYAAGMLAGAREDLLSLFRLVTRLLPSGPKAPAEGRARSV
jgi:putative peptidoglycan lipid II flippase